MITVGPNQVDIPTLFAIVILATWRTSSWIGLDGLVAGYRQRHNDRRSTPENATGIVEVGQQGRLDGLPPRSRMPDAATLTQAGRIGACALWFAVRWPS